MALKRNSSFRRLGTVLLIGVSSLALWVAIEGTLTVVSFFRSVVHQGSGELANQPLFEPHQELGWVPRANLDVPNGMGQGRPVTTDRRGRRKTPPPQGDGLSVYCSGDSFTFGDKVGDHQTWCFRLASSSGIRRTINGGVSGYGLDQIYLRAQQKKVRYDAHVLGLILDDITRMKSFQSPFGPLKPTLSLEKDRLKVHTDWLGAPGFIQWAIRRIHLADRLPSVRFLQKTVPNPYGASPKEWDHLIKITEKVMTQLRSQTKAGRLLVLLFPTRHDLFNGKRPSHRKRVHTVLKRNRIEFIDFVERWEGYRFSRVEDFFLPDGHLSAEGHAEVARTVSQKLKGLNRPSIHKPMAQGWRRRRSS